MPSDDLTPAGLAGLLAEPRRLRALAAVALGATSAEAVQDAAGLSARHAAEALHRLTASGVVATGPDGLRVDEAVLRGLAAVRPDAPEEPAGELRPFVRGERLVSLPASRTRRRTVLAHVAEHALEAGQTYDEAAVDLRLKAWCEGGEVDHAALRRYLVEEGLVARGGGTYVLGAGPVPTSEGERYVAALGLS